MSTGTATEIVITGLGITSPAGTGVDTAWTAVCEGVPTARQDPGLTGLAVDFACRVPDFDPRRTLGPRVCRRTDRCTQMGLTAAHEALAEAGLDTGRWGDTRAGVVMGTAFGGVDTLLDQTEKFFAGRSVSPVLIPKFVPNMPAGQIALETGAQGPSLAVATACASGTTAIATGCDLLRSDACDVVLAGGADAPVNRLIASSFARMDALSRRDEDPERASRPFDETRDGFVLGEGAAVLVLERAADARARHVRPLARLAGHGASSDAHHITAPHPEGAGLQHAVRAALDVAGAGTDDVDHINAHATGTPLGDLAEARALTGLFPGLPSVTASKGVLGHTMGAAGAIEAALTVRAVSEGLVPPTANLERQDPLIDLDIVGRTPRKQHIHLALSSSCGFGGQNAVLAICPP